MSINYTSSLKNTRMAAVISAIGNTGVLEIGTSGMSTVLVRFSLDATAGTVNTGILTFSGTPKTSTVLDTGTAAVARIKTGVSGTDIITGLTVGTSASDIILSSVSLVSGSQITLTSASITHS